MLVISLIAMGLAHANGKVLYGHRHHYHHRHDNHDSLDVMKITMKIIITL